MRKLLVKGAQSQPLSGSPGESLGCLQGGSCRGDLTQLCPGRSACVGARVGEQRGAGCAQLWVGAGEGHGSPAEVSVEAHIASALETVFGKGVTFLSWFLLAPSLRRS